MQDSDGNSKMKYQESRSIRYFPFGINVSILRHYLCNSFAVISILKYHADRSEVDETKVRCSCLMERKRHLRKSFSVRRRLHSQCIFTKHNERNHIIWMTHRLLSLPPPVRLGGLRFCTITACHK
ncbi:uncharacterized protein LOC142333297 isoform X1 [Lycorma delicatula]|uniref:uncharacterized protein LOC142333297 isoform X1 n=1 Tax=Lycorma delicatula TaxID=130591 RepID=UPI003F518CB5